MVRVSGPDSGDLASNPTVVITIGLGMVLNDASLGAQHREVRP